MAKSDLIMQIASDLTVEAIKANNAIAQPKSKNESIAKDAGKRVAALYKEILSGVKEAHKSITDSEAIK
jgi:GTP cyclohydrolase I